MRRSRRISALALPWLVFIAFFGRSFPVVAASYDMPQPYAAAGPSAHPAVVRVIVQDRDGMSLGSGTLIYVTDRHGLVITNWHVVRDRAGPVEVAFPDGFRSAGTVIKVDNVWDLAAIGIWRPNVAPVELATAAPRPGEMLTIAGYGSGSYRAARGRCLPYVSPGTNYPYQIIELGAEARHGDSGGPIFNERGQLAGVLLGASNGRTVGSYCGRVGTFLADVTPLLDQQRTDGKQQMFAATSGAATNSSGGWAAGEPEASPASPWRPSGAVAAFGQRPGSQEGDDEGRFESRGGATAEVAQLPPSSARYSRSSTQHGSVPAQSPSSEAPGWSGSTESSALPAVNPSGRTGDPYLHWEDVAGHTRGEQAKTLLAAIGALALLLTTLRVLLRV